MLRNKSLRLVLAALFLALAFGFSFVGETEAQYGSGCWFCISWDMCQESNFGSQGCTVTSGGHGCQYQCQELGGPCMNF